MKHSTSFVVEVQEDIASGELFIPIPEYILNQKGWYEGMELEWNIDGDELILTELDHD